MEINPAKCGVLSFGSSAEVKVGVVTQQGPIPDLESYTYLGVEMTKTLSRMAMAERRRKKGLECLLMLEKKLRSPSLPIGHKTLLIRGIVMPTVTYGAEIFGSTGVVTKGSQGVINLAMKMVAGGNCALTAVRRDLVILPVQAIAAERQKRAWGKFPYLKTVGARIFDEKRVLPYGWTGRTKRELKTRTGRDTTWELLESKDTTESWARYQKLGLKRS
ncbi:MAG: uncharacterized protein A8A55_3325, partial [Amphiamblys sp. WSBS2006]